MIKIVEKIVQYQFKTGLSQNKIAKLIGISNSYFSQLMNERKKNPSQEVKGRINRLVGGEDADWAK